ncbi:TIGR04086 family membrane protein [Agathobaculum sp.]|uniref:TIGR04086 family membrane protein n=1 Tax=Agathobaculum sp. TaxID=2048138 RepID=UPI002671EC67|nr:TIGR04086 family membrane protein [uncultured Agathobaculum sp.]
MRKTNEGASPVRLILLAAFAGLAATLVLMLISAALVHRGTLGEAMIPTISLACLALGCMLASFLAARRLPDGRLALALAGGAVVFLVLLAVCAFALSQPVRFGRTAVSLLCAVAASVLGTAVGIYMRTKNKHSHLKK